MPRDLLGQDRAGEETPPLDYPISGGAGPIVSTVIEGDADARAAVPVPEVDIGTGSFGVTIRMRGGFGHQAGVFAWLGVAFLGLVFVVSLGQAFGLPQRYYLVFFTAAAIAGMGIGLWSAWRARQRQIPARGFPMVPNLRSRVRVVVRPDQATTLRDAIHEMRSTGFEVEVVRAWFSKGFTRLQWVVFGIVGLGVFTGLYVLGSSMPRNILPALNPFQFFGAFAAGAFAADACWPTYLRVAPGRLDRLQFGFLGRGRGQVETFDLRRMRVWVFIPARLVVLLPEDHEEFPQRAGGFQMLNPRAVGGAAISVWSPGHSAGFLRLVVAGALADVDSPPLPEDGLVA
ncbi:MAG: hypothetical protein KF866_08220 [Phycisphaeraceae bacterium]|nr:hypothetical protein [Phycisphaeraceae bacterium]MCW5753862.1 hypothetical protein [Phycisphaeraceae bacterium]